MPYNFGELSAEQAIRLIQIAYDPLVAREQQSATPTTISETAGAVRSYLAGDHWQDGAGWVGPKPDDVQGSGVPDMHALNLIEERFVSRNMIEDVVTRHVDGVVGREPSWGFTPKEALADDEAPSTADQTMIDEVEARLTEWWDRRRIHALWQRSTAEMILSGRAVLRLYVPAARLVPLPAAPLESDLAGQTRGPQLVTSGIDSGVTPETSADLNPMVIDAGTQGVEASDLEEALNQIHVEVAIAEAAAVFIDADSMEKLGIFVYYRQGDLPGTLGPRVVELSYLDGDASVPHTERNTIIRNLGLNVDEQPITLALGGRLMHYALERPPLVGASIISLQKALNLACSMSARNVETTQYLERILGNAQLPGTWELDVDGQRTGRFIEGTYVTGAGVTNFIQGAEVRQPDESVTLATPSVTFRPPSETRPTIEAIEAFSAEILREAKQGHVLGSDQIQSGVSRTQARADFEKSLGRSQAAIEPAGRWLLETVLTLAQLFAATVGDEGTASTSLRAEFSCITDTGPLDPQEKLTVTTAGTTGYLSREWVQQALGVEDTDAETARINAEPGMDNAIRQKKAITLKAFIDAGLSPEAAAELAGFETKEIDLIKKDAAANPVPAPAPAGMTPKLGPDGKPVIDPTTGLPVLQPQAPVTPQPPAPQAPTAPGASAPPQRAPAAA